MVPSMQVTTELRVVDRGSDDAMVTMIGWNSDSFLSRAVVVSHISDPALIRMTRRAAPSGGTVRLGACDPPGLVYGQCDSHRG